MNAAKKLLEEIKRHGSHRAALLHWYLSSNRRSEIVRDFIVLEPILDFEKEAAEACGAPGGTIIVGLETGNWKVFAISFEYCVAILEERPDQDEDLIKVLRDGYIEAKLPPGTGKTEQ